MAMKWYARLLEKQYVSFFLLKLVPNARMTFLVVLLSQVVYSMYSETSEQRTLWDQYKFKWLVPCIEVVLFKRFQLL